MMSTINQLDNLNLSGNGNTSWMNPPNSNTLDEIIPNAVVIKNIPFSLPKDQLLSIIHDLNIPTPYAFNYHYDTSNPSNDPAFRGLAFANFRTSHDASAIVAALNGFDVLGRKLRVEYKKVLHPQDKERIERDKALRRMASLGINNPLPFNPPDSFDDSPTNVFDSVLSDRDSQASPPTMCHAELDLNDPSTLEIYSRILVFKEDRMRDDLAFSKNLTMSQRRIVHLVAQRLSVYHYSIGQGDDRFVIVSRNPPEPPTPRNDPARSLKHSSSTITRGGRPDLVSNTSFLSPASTGIGMQIPPGLRTKKSMPDMKRLNGSATFNTAPGLTSRASNSNLKEAYSSIRTAPDLQGVSFAPPMLSGRRSATLGPGPPGNGGFASLFAPPHSHSDAAGAGAGTNAARTYSEAGTFHPPPLPFPLDLATHHGSATPSEQSLTTSPAQMSAAQLTSPPVRQPRGPPSTTASQGFSQPPSRGISSPALSPHPSPRLNQQLPIASHLKHPHTSNFNHTHPFTHSLPLNTSSSTSSPHTLTERTNEIMHSNNE